MKHSGFASLGFETPNPVHSSDGVARECRKLEEKGKSAKDVRDTAQLRVVLHLRASSPCEPAALSGNSSQLCYHVMGLVHTIWAPIPGSVKDYIATPKMNGYQVRHSRGCCTDSVEARGRAGVSAP